MNDHVLCACVVGGCYVSVFCVRVRVRAYIVGVVIVVYVHMRIVVSCSACTATFQNSIGERFWSTVGASYCLLLWGWLWSLIFIITKVMLPGIAFSFEG